MARSATNETLVTAIKEILQSNAASTQTEIQKALIKKGHEVTQATVSRTLQKIGAKKALSRDGKSTYELSTGRSNTPFSIATTPETLSDLVLSIKSNGAMVVIRTTEGSASFVARMLDINPPAKILGTLAGDDTIFVAPQSISEIQAVLSDLNGFFKK